MSENKRYFWIKLPTIYFNTLSQKKMRKHENGLLMQVIYLKLMLLSCNTNGVIYYQGVYDTIAEEIAEEINEDTESVKAALDYFEKNNLLEYQEHDAIIPQALELIGSKTQVAERVQRYRENIKALQCNANVTECNANVTKCNIEGEGEGEKEGEEEGEEEEEGEARNAQETPPPLPHNYKYLDLSGEDYNKLLEDYGKNITDSYIIKAERTGENRKRVIDNSLLYICRMIEKDYTPEQIQKEKEKAKQIDLLEQIERQALRA